jgi:tetratricopeptide (TPR) repeat protein
MRLALALVLLQAVSPEARHHIQAGLEAKKAGRLDEAIAELRRVVEIEPRLWAAHASLGEVYYKKRDYAHAVPALERAIELNPEQPAVRGMLGVSLLSQGRAAEAVPHLEKSQAPDALGVAYLETGRYADAVRSLQEALDRNPKDANALFYLGQALGRWSKATFDRVLAEHPESTRARQLRAEALAAAGRPEAAEREYRELLRADPGAPGVHFALAELLAASGEIEKTIEEYSLEIGLAPAAAALARRGAMLLKLGRAREALADLDRANNLRPDSPDVLYELARAHDLLGNAREAESAWLRVIAVAPKSAEAVQAHHQLARFYRRSGNMAAAERHSKEFEGLR